MCLGILYPTQSWLMPYVLKILSSTKASPSHYHPVSYGCIFLHFFLLPKPNHAHQQHDVRSQSIYPVKNISTMGCSRKDPHFPHFWSMPMAVNALVLAHTLHSYKYLTTTLMAVGFIEL